MARKPPTPTVGALALLVVLALLVPACGGNSASSNPTSASPTVTNLSIIGSPVATITGNTGQGYSFLALVQYSNLTSADVTKSATWSTSNSQIAAFFTVGGFPQLATFQRGTVTVTVSYGGKTASMTVTVS